MKMYIKGLAALFITCSAFNAQAHTYTFKNNLTVPVTVSMAFAAKSGYETKRVEAGGEIKFEYKIGHLWAGLCLNRNNLRLKKEDGTMKEAKEAPIIYVTQHTYDVLMNDVKKLGKTRDTLGIVRFEIASVCESRRFDIVADPDGIPRAITIMGWF